MQEIVERGTPVQRYRRSVAQFVRAPLQHLINTNMAPLTRVAAGKQIKLINKDNRPTPEGRAYYAALGRASAHVSATLDGGLE